MQEPGQNWLPPSSSAQCPLLPPSKPFSVHGSDRPHPRLTPEHQFTQPAPQGSARVSTIGNLRWPWASTSGSHHKPLHPISLPSQVKKHQPVTLQLNIQLAGTKDSIRLSMLTSNKSKALETLTRKGSYHHGKNGSDPHRLDTMTLSEVANSHQSPFDLLTPSMRIPHQETAI